MGIRNNYMAAKILEMMYQDFLLVEEDFESGGGWDLHILGVIFLGGSNSHGNWLPA